MLEHNTTTEANNVRDNGWEYAATESLEDTPSKSLPTDPFAIGRTLAARPTVSGMKRKAESASLSSLEDDDEEREREWRPRTKKRKARAFAKAVRFEEIETLFQMSDGDDAETDDMDDE